MADIFCSVVVEFGLSEKTRRWVYRFFSANLSLRKDHLREFLINSSQLFSITFLLGLAFRFCVSNLKSPKARQKQKLKIKKMRILIRLAFHNRFSTLSFCFTSQNIFIFLLLKIPLVRRTSKPFSGMSNFSPLAHLSYAHSGRPI